MLRKPYGCNIIVFVGAYSGLGLLEFQVNMFNILFEGAQVSSFFSFFFKI